MTVLSGTNWLTVQVQRRAKQLYPTAADVQTQRVVFSQRTANQRVDLYNRRRCLRANYARPHSASANVISPHTIATFDRKVMDDAAPRRSLVTCRCAWLRAGGGCCAVLLTLILALGFVAPRPVHAARRTLPAARCGDVQVWSVSTHGLDACDAQTASTAEVAPTKLSAQSSLGVQSWSCCGGWQPADMAGLLASDTCTAPTCIYIHGYNNSEEDARDGGLAVYQALAGGGEHANGLRLIVWMWPSERTAERPIESFRAVADVAEEQAAHLAQFLTALPESCDVVLWGHSYGARLATAALHQLGGGALCGMPPLEKPEQLCCLRAVLTAAALDDDWLLPGERHGCALSALGRLLVLASPADPVLKRYSWTRPGESPQALGSRGIDTSRLTAEDLVKVRQVNVSGLIGVAHVSKRYLRSYGVVDMIREEILRQQAVAPPRWTGNVVGRGPQHSTAR